jgi:hypothetical protein
VCQILEAREGAPIGFGGDSEKEVDPECSTLTVEVYNAANTVALPPDSQEEEPEKQSSQEEG